MAAKPLSPRKKTMGVNRLFWESKDEIICLMPDWTGVECATWWVQLPKTTWAITKDNSLTPSVIFANENCPKRHFVIKRGVASFCDDDAVMEKGTSAPLLVVGIHMVEDQIDLLPPEQQTSPLFTEDYPPLNIR